MKIYGHERRYSPEELREKIEKITEHCEKTEEPPVSWTMEKAAGISQEEIDSYWPMFLAAEGADDFMQALRYLDHYKEYYFLKLAMKDPRQVRLALEYTKRLCRNYDDEQGKLFERLEKQWGDMFDGCNTKKEEAKDSVIQNERELEELQEMQRYVEEEEKKMEEIIKREYVATETVDEDCWD